MLRVPRHKVFVSYHHQNDQGYRDRFERMFADVYDIMDSRSVRIGESRRDCIWTRSVAGSVTSISAILR